MKRRADPTRLYELVVAFAGRERRVSCNIESNDQRQFLSALADDCKQHLFYEVGGPEGRHCLFNTAHVTRLNLLDHLPGLHIEAKAELTSEEAEEEDDVRAVSDEPVILRLWLRGTEEPIVHHEVDYEQWKYFKIGLIEGDKFIRFTDEDREDVIYGTDHLDAIEMIDPFYLEEGVVEKILAHPESDSPLDPSDSPPLNDPLGPTES